MEHGHRWNIPSTKRQTAMLGSDLIAILVDRGIMFVAGLAFSYFGFLSPDPRYRRFRTLFRFGGPCLVVISVVLFISDVVRR